MCGLRPVGGASPDAEGLLPDMLTFDPSRPAKYPNGRSADGGAG